MGTLTEKRPDTTSGSGKRMKMSARDAVGLIRRAKRRGAKVDVKPALAKPTGPVQKKAGCSLCAMAGGSGPETAPPGYSCPLCSGKGGASGPALEAPRDSVQHKGAGTEDAAEAQADALGAQIGAELGGAGSVSSGPIPSGVRSVAERHLGVGLGGTELRADAGAHSRTASVGALAMTEGSTVSFGAGQLSTSTAAGRSLLGHELTHVAQQRAHGTAARQGFLDDSPDDPSASSLAPNAGGATPSPADADGPSILGLGVGFGTADGGGRAAVDVTVDAEGNVSVNVNVNSPGAAQPGAGGLTVPTSDAPLERCPDGSWVPPGALCSGPPEPALPPRPVCGPNVTSNVRDVLDRVDRAFRAWPKQKRVSQCAFMFTPAVGTQWDIMELHVPGAWIGAFRPACATPGHEPKCDASVAMRTGCWYSGSVNYVLLGKMARLCGLTGFAVDALLLAKLAREKGQKANFVPSLAWAHAGLAGWPSSGDPSRPDRPNCEPSCSSPVVASFVVVWGREVIT